VNRSFVAFVLLTGACGVESAPTDEEVAELLGHGPRLLQAGTGITLFETTETHAIYQLGQQVFAVAPGCDPELIGDVPAGNTAFVYQAGKVAFVWTNPDRTQPGFGVSPLYIWSRDTGSQLASESSPIGTLAATASADGDLVAFPTNAADAAGTSGDLELAATDLSSRTTLASGVAMLFNSGPCQPRLGFLGDGNKVVGLTCAAGTTTAAFSTWRDGVRTDFAQPVSPARLRLDQDHERAVTTLAGSRYPVVIDRDGNGTVIAEEPAVNAFFAGDGAVIYLTPPAPGGLPSAFRARIGHEPEYVTDLAGFNAPAFGSTGLSLPITSPDGRLLSYFDAVGSFGLATNTIVADVRGHHEPTTLHTSPADLLFGVPFTKDSDYTLYAELDTVTFAVGPMFAAGPRGNRQFSDDIGWAWDAAFDSTITYNDNTTLDPVNVFLSTADLKSVDLSRTTLAPKLIAEQANVTYFSTHHGRAVVYTIDTGADAGLYIARVR
jgi:hypothetical protein